VWVMGRRVGGTMADGETSQSLESFLELKLENERLQAELRELHQSLYEHADGSFHFHNALAASASAATATRTGWQSYLPDEDSSEAESEEDEMDEEDEEEKQEVRKARLGRPPKDVGAKRARDGKRQKVAMPAVIAAQQEGMHVCVTCGRTDSPEWRKGPLGPKTLCNACGLRWAKRNSSQPARRDKKKDAGTKRA